MTIQGKIDVTCDVCGTHAELPVVESTMSSATGDGYVRVDVIANCRPHNKPHWVHTWSVALRTFVDVCPICQMIAKYTSKTWDALLGDDKDGTPVGWECAHCGHKRYGDNPPNGWYPSDDGWLCTLCRPEREL